MKYVLMFVLALSLTGCAGLTKKGKIGVACDGAASAAQAIAAAANAGQVTQAQLDDARRLYHTTDKFCEPVVEDVSVMEYAELLTVTAELIRRGK